MQEESLFHAALAQNTPQKRTEFLEQACGGDRELCSAMEALVAAHDRSGRVLAPLVVTEENWPHGGDWPRAELANQSAQNHETESRAETTDPCREQSASGNVPVNVKLPVRIGRYEIRKELGHGGMGTVYLAHDPELDRLIALKVPLLAGPDAEERFLRESRAAAAVNHPNLCPVYDAGRADGVLYLAMAYIPSVTLSQVLKEAGALPLPRATAIAEGVARGMAEAHRHGIVHRDLKPGNILFDRHGEPVVTDFGLACRENIRNFENLAEPLRDADRDWRLTRAGAFLGTPAYMPPEQALGNLEKIGPASDVYALGAILYEMLTGGVPFRGDSIGEMRRQIERAPIPPMPGVPVGLQAICRRALAKDSAGRTPSMEAFLADLSTFASTRRTRTRRRIAVAMAACGLSLLAGVILFIATNNGTIEVRLSDPKADVTVRVNGEAVELSEGGRITKLRAGTHALEVQGAGFETETRLFKLTRGDKTLLEIELKTKAPLVRAEESVDLPNSERAKLAKLLHRGRRLLDQNQLEDLKAVSVEALAIDPTSPRGLAFRAVAFAGQGRYEEAHADANAALKLNPEVREALLASAIVHAHHGQVDDAIVDDTAAIRIEPNHPRAWLNRSKSYLTRKDYRQAISDSTRALELKADDSDALLCRAAAFAFLGDDERALADNDLAASRTPKNWLVFNQRSSLHARLGNEIEEKKDWERVKTLRPQAAFENRPVFGDRPKAPEQKLLSVDQLAVAAAALEEAQNAWDTGRLADCQSATDKALRVDPASGFALAWRARLLASSGRFDEAVSVSSIALQFEPTVSWAYVTRGVARINLKRQAAGIADLTIAVTMNPEDWAAWYNRGLGFMERGQFHQALSDYTESLRHRPNQPEAHVNRGVCHLSLGNYQTALLEYDKAIEGQPANGRWRLVRGAIRAKLGDSAGAHNDQNAAFEMDQELRQLPDISFPKLLLPAKVDPQDP